MARGWESKSVESQMETAQNANGAHSKDATAEDLEERKIEQERRGLLLSRAYLLQRLESSSHERYTESLRRALSEIEDKLSRLQSEQ